MQVYSRRRIVGRHAAAKDNGLWLKNTKNIRQKTPGIDLSGDTVLLISFFAKQPRELLFLLPGPRLQALGHNVRTR